MAENTMATEVPPTGSDNDAGGSADKDLTSLPLASSEDGIVIEKEGSPSALADELKSQLRLTITESEASTCFGEDGDVSTEVEAFIEAEMDSAAAPAAVSPLKEDDSVVEQTNENTSTMAPLLAGVVSKDSTDGGRQSSPNSVAGMDQPQLSMASEGTHPPPTLPLTGEYGSIIAATASSDSSVVLNREKLDSPRTKDVTVTKSSSMLDSLLGGVGDVSLMSEVESSSVVLSDASESRCTFASTSPVVNLTISGDDEHDEKMVALGIFARAATADGEVADIVSKGSDPSLYTAADVSASTSMTDDNSNVIKTTISSGSASPLNEIEATSSMTTSSKLGRISPINTDTEVKGERSASRSRSPRKSRSPLPISPSSVTISGFDKKRLSERLKQRLAKRNQMSASAGSPTTSVKGDSSPTSTKSGSDKLRDTSHWETRLQAATSSRQKRRSKARAKSESSESANSDILSKYSGSEVKDNAGRKIYPDTVTFSDGEGDPTALLVNTKIASRDRRTVYRKCVSEVGVSLSQSTRAAHSKLSKHHHSHHHGIGILQADGIVYDDALLLRLARQARYGRLRGEVSHAVADKEGANAGDLRVNDVKIHVYDLLTKDSLVEVPYFNCNFPIGQCFKVVNDGCHVLGTGVYHVGVEVNGVEYAFGANNIIGMSGIFTCVPKESPGYEYRETLDFGKMHTTKRTWIRVPKSGGGPSFKTISAALGGAIVDNHDDKTADEKSSTPPDLSASQRELYSFREIETFADGHAVIHSMAREYMGTDYDLLRKNCCTFARDVCIRLGTKEGDIPRWFHNAAQAGADAEDAITNVEESVRNMLDCAEEGDPLDMECYNHGFEIIMEDDGEEQSSTTKLKVVESPTMRTPRERKPLRDDLCDSVHETASWTY